MHSVATLPPPQRKSSLHADTDSRSSGSDSSVEYSHGNLRNRSAAAVAQQDTHTEHTELPGGIAHQEAVTHGTAAGLPAGEIPEEAPSAVELFWSIDTAPSRQQLGREWGAFIAAAVLRAVLGLGLIALGAISFEFTGVADDLPSFLSQTVVTARVLAVVFGTVYGLMALVGSWITVRMLHRYTSQENIGNRYKHEIISTRWQLLVGLIFAGFLCIPLGILNDQICGARLVPDADLEGIAAAADLCSKALPVSATLFATACAVCVVNAMIAIWGFQGYFAAFASIAYVRFAAGAVLFGISWLQFVILRAVRRSPAYDSMSGDPRIQVDLYYHVVVDDGVFAAIVNLASSLFSLFASWYRSKFYIAVDVGLSFTAFWFTAPPAVSIFWALELKSFFCGFEDFTESLPNALTEGLCSRNLLRGATYALSLFLTVMCVVVCSLSIIGFSCWKPREWHKPQRSKL